MKSGQANSIRVLRHVSHGALAFTLLALPSLASAQAVDQPSGGVGEIVVQAQRRSQNLQDVGVAVTALDNGALKRLNIVDSKDIARAVPGVLLDSTAGGGVNANLSVRGVSQSDFSSVQESPNSIYIDEVYLSSPNAAAFTFYDLQQVEVLRGPQGTLFGRASSGGLANFITAKPTKDFTGYAEIGYSSFNNAYIEAAVSGPLSDRVRFRIAGRAERADGWFENGLAGGEDTFEKRFFGVRGQLEADLTETLTARLSVSFDKNPRHLEGMYRTEPAYLDANGNPALLPASIDAHGTGAGNDFAGYRNPYKKYNKADFNNVGYLQNERFAPTLNLKLDVGQATITSITNYTSFSYRYNEDCDGGPVDLCGFPLGQDLKQFSQEMRVNGKSGSLNYTAGVYYLNTRQDAPVGFVFPALAGTDFAFDDINLVNQKVESYAVFGQLEYELTPTLRATAGLRYTYERKDIDSKVFFNELGNGYSGGVGSTVFVPPLLIYDFSAATVGDLATNKENLWSGKIQLDYKPSRGTLFYISASRGVKAGGFNTNVSGNLTNAETPFKSEYVHAFEAGAKLELFDRKLRWNTSVFYYDYHRFQGFAFNGLQGVVGNYDGNFKGGEIELTAAPTRDLDLTLSAAYLDSKLRGVPTAYYGLRDQQSIMAPNWTVNGSVTKRFELGLGTLSVNWNGNYIDDRYASIDNTAGTLVPGSFVHNARIGLDMKDSGLEVAVFVNNISNKARMNFTYDLIASTGSFLQSFDKPRWIGGSIRKTF